MITERECGEALVKLLRRKRSKRATMRECIESLPRYLRLDAHDLSQSASRPSEQKFVSAIRNLRSHGTAAKYGLRATPEGGFAI